MPTLYGIMQAFLNRLHSTALAAHEGLDTDQPQQQPIGVTKPLQQAGAQPPSVQPVGTDNWSANQLPQSVGTDNCSASQVAQPVGTNDCSAHQLAQPVGTDSQSATCVALCACRPQLQEAASMCTDHLDTIDIMCGEPPTAQSLQNAGDGLCQGENMCTWDSSQVDNQLRCKLRAAEQLTEEQLGSAVAAGELLPSCAADATAVTAEGHQSGKNRPAVMAGQQVQLSLEWLRTASPQVAAAFLMSVEGKPHVAHKLPYCNIHTHCVPKRAQSVAVPSLHTYNRYVSDQVQTWNSSNLHLPRYMSIIYVQTRQQQQIRLVLVNSAYGPFSLCDATQMC